MAQRSYSYVDPVLASKLSGLADQFVEGPIRARQAAAERQKFDAEAGLATQKTQGLQAEQFGRQGVAHFFNLNDPSKVNQLMAQAFTSGSDGQDLGNLSRAFMLNNPEATNAQRLGAFAGAGGNVDQDSAFTEGAQDYVATRNSRNSIAEEVAKINATPLSLTQAQGAAFSGLTRGQQVAGLFDPVNTAPGNVVSYAPDDPRFPGGSSNNQFRAPYTPAQSGEGSGGTSSAKNWTDPATNESGITFDGITDSSTGARLPKGAVMALNSALQGEAFSPLDAARMADLEYTTGLDLDAYAETINKAPLPADVRNAVLTEVMRMITTREVDSGARALPIAMRNLGVEYIDNNMLNFVAEDDHWAMSAQPTGDTPTATLPSGLPASGQVSPASGQTAPDKAQSLLEEARFLIQNNYDVEEVKQTLRDNGVDPDQL